MRVEERSGGIYLADTDLHLDPRSRVDSAVVSHAHGDHIARHGRVLATPETLALYRHRLGAGRAGEGVAYGRPVRIGDFQVTLFPAGHCLGSAQVLVEWNGRRLVYTGDFKLRANPTAGTAAIIPCDVLITESTFGEPWYRFPAHDRVQAEIVEFCLEATLAGVVPVILAYSLGKAQELIWLLGEAGLETVLHRAVWGVTEVYRELGVRFPAAYHLFAHRLVEGRVLITPPGTHRQPPVSALRRRVAVASGWAMHPAGARFHRGVDAQFAFSDHADFDELVRYARECGASRIYTVHGERGLAGHLRRLGLDARNLADEADPAQKPLFE